MIVGCSSTPIWRDIRKSEGEVSAKGAMPSGRGQFAWGALAAILKHLLGANRPMLGSTTRPCPSALESREALPIVDLCPHCTGGLQRCESKVAVGWS
jgi:hypothetical protein